MLGVVENMSGFTVNGSAAPGTEVSIAAPGGKTLSTTADEQGNFSVTLDIFKEGGGKDTAENSVFLSSEHSPLTLALFGEGTTVSTASSLNPMGLPPKPLPRWSLQFKTNCRTAQIAALRSFEVAP